ncbi:hypothetical protein NIASO_08310 [Niabella soli DSM 19437]|uniref:Uncharacterized protein n=1 Tax=Niabella soli DSM 19437 TaxID=929713 RepID=W0F7N4_9BACT|nr:hypothetical protein NIASO_08310 [Niabella soli DSM 19437]
MKNIMENDFLKEDEEDFDPRDFLDGFEEDE